MSSLNKVCLIGNLGRDPEIRTLNNGGKVCNLSVATSERWRDKSSGQMQERTQWHRIVIWVEQLVSVAERFLSKGSKVYLEGQLETRKWQNQSGQDQYTTEVVLRPYASKLVMLDSRNSGGGGQRQADPQDGYAGDDGYTPSQQQDDNDLDDEIPF